MFDCNVSEKVITLPPTSREGADKDSYHESADNESPGAGATKTDRFPQISLGTDVERYKLSSGFHNCASDWGNSNDEIDWDALTNGDINGDVD